MEVDDVPLLHTESARRAENEMRQALVGICPSLYALHIALNSPEAVHPLDGGEPLLLVIDLNPNPQTPELTKSKHNVESQYAGRKDPQ